MRQGIGPILKETKEDKLIDSGFPQGSPLSPLLSIFCKNNGVFGLLDHVMYADDGLLFDVIEDMSPEELNDEDRGIEINVEKSG